jgi:hypothetical protein
LDSWVGQRNPLGCGDAEGGDLALRLSLSSRHVLDYLLLADADLREMFEKLLHGWGGLAA